MPKEMALPLPNSKSRPPDLTTLAKRNKGKFPSDYVTLVVVTCVTEKALHRA
jgi:hypothetical protein